MKEVKLPSGSTLIIIPADFATSRECYRAVVEEGKQLVLDPNAEVDVNLYKDLLCIAMGSRKIEKAIWDCLKKCTINKLPITNETFEPVEKRDDYLTVMIEVAKENVFPFTKSLYAEYAPIFRSILQTNLASRSATTNLSSTSDSSTQGTVP